VSYCETSPGHEWHGPYHGTEYGFPVDSDDVLFERLVLEINQAGLSWLTVLKKRQAFSAAYDGFSIERIASYGDVERARLLSDAGIIRNKLKVNAAIENAKKVMELKESNGTFKEWLDAQHPMKKPEWVALFKRTFLFTGGEITGEFLMSTGYLPGAHDETCPVGQKLAMLRPPWTTEDTLFWR
jgi:DNA-3-methyladenine glycosylase I